MRRRFCCRILLALLSASGASAAPFPDHNIQVEFSAQSLVLHGVLVHGTDSFKVYAKDSQNPLFGVSKQRAQGYAFEPVVPFIQGKSYRVEVEKADGTWEKLELAFGWVKKWDIGASPSLIVHIAPVPTVLPANALKLYLHFSHPMEQGVFLDRLTLLRQDGSVVQGPFRETELWSPDGKRLTLWLHPGRQKTGVNLNTDEGPVLREGETHTLKIAAAWRSAEGVALGKEFAFPIIAGAIDHACPEPQRWKIIAPKAGTRDSLHLLFDEALDPAMLHSALTVNLVKTRLAGAVQVATDARSWSFTPTGAWPAGSYTLEIDPLLEDLAGNNLQHSFEVDREQPVTPAKVPVLKIEVR